MKIGKTLKNGIGLRGGIKKQLNGKSMNEKNLSEFFFKIKAVYWICLFSKCLEYHVQFKSCSVIS